MAALIAKNAVSTAVVSARPQRQVVKTSAALKPACKAAPSVSSRESASCMQVWQPINNK